MESFTNGDSASRPDPSYDGIGLKRLLAAMRCFADLEGQMEIQRMLTFLLAARQNRPISMTALRDKTGMSAAGDSRNTHYWAGLGFVRVDEDVDDHRERVVSLTVKGKQFAARLEEACQ